MTQNLRDFVDVTKSKIKPKTIYIEDFNNIENQEMKHTESKLQIACVNWFSYQYPNLSPLFFAVPNGGKRTLTEAKILKAEGVKRGVSDLLLLVPNAEYNFLAIEMKAEKGIQSPNQKQWQKSIEALGFGKYIICRSTTEFIFKVNEYLKNSDKQPKV